MAGGKKKNNSSWFWWLMVFLIFTSSEAFWLIGLCFPLLIAWIVYQGIKSSKSGSTSSGAVKYTTSTGTVRPSSATAAKPAAGKTQDSKKALGKLQRGKIMTIAGSIMAGLGAFWSVEKIVLWWGTWRWMLEEASPFLAILVGGLALAYYGLKRQKKAKRFQKYQALIGKNTDISIVTLAQAMPAKVQETCDDLQEMLDEGWLPTGYIDMSSGRLVLGTEGIKEERHAPEKDEDDTLPDNDNEILARIRKADEDIADEEMSRKIARIGEITSKILNYQKQNPGKAGELRSFLNYYLPTTLKLLDAYAQMESQGIEGENIRAAKARIEGMMDKVVEGFEKQLDRLFADSAMDITTDVEVLEKMLQKDGLSGKDVFTQEDGITLTLGG